MEGAWRGYGETKRRKRGKGSRGEMKGDVLSERVGEGGERRAEIEEEWRGEWEADRGKGGRE